MPLGRVLSLLSAQPAALLGSEGPRHADRGQLCRCGGLRSQGGVDLPRDGVEIEGEEYALRRLDDAGQSALDGQRRTDRVRKSDIIQHFLTKSYIFLHILHELEFYKPFRMID